MLTKTSQTLNVVVGEIEMGDREETKRTAIGSINSANAESLRLELLKDVRAPIISEVMAENPTLTKEQLIQMMEEMGF